ncbi:MAG: methyltransferase [Deltaproteobacteria bacterium]|nr:methyltransferase [Deltaproteobacteria bacterium]
MANADPWYKASFKLEALGKHLELQVPHDVFSTMRIDEGTQLLLSNLPAGEPETILDMGCGYGALGLPLAARHPGARVRLVDRDLLAVAWATKNAEANGLTANVRASGSLGYRDLHDSDAASAAFDWILCNVPARIGRPFIEQLVKAGRARLTARGELRVVVIRDLVPVLEELAKEHGWALVESARGPRHSVFALAAPREPVALVPEPNDLYLRDTVSLGGLKLERPFDIGGDDPKRLTHGLPLLLDALPRKAPRTVLCFRSGYGPLPLVCRARYGDSQVTAVDRDLLGTTYTRRNAERLGLGGPRLEVLESAHFPDAFADGRKFDFITGELSPSAGAAVAEAELTFLVRALAPGGEGLVLSLKKLESSWIRPIAERRDLAIFPVISRDDYVLLAVTAKSLKSMPR